jgi:phosphoserine phosphatase RsbU/P
MPSEEPAVLAFCHDSDSRQQIRASMVRHDLSTVESMDVSAARSALNDRDIRLVACDLDLPGSDALLEILAQEHTGVPIIAFSASTTTETPVEAFRRGADDYLSKPLTGPMLDESLDRILSGLRFRRRTARYLADLERTNGLLRQNLQRLRDDEESGRRLQFQLLPPERQQFDSYHFSRRLWTSLYLSGDFVDYFRIDDQHSGFYIADVAGHGASPAMITVLLKSYMNRYLELYRQAKNRGILDPARIFGRINQNMLKSDMDKHLTMFYGIIDHANNRLCYGNAGQFPYPILYDGEQVRYIETRGKPLGLFEFAEYRTVGLPLPERFMLTLLSDGILELLPQSQLSDKLAYLLDMFSNPGNTPASLSKHLGLTRADTLPDDVTMLQIRRGF